MTSADILKKCNEYIQDISRAPALSCVEYYFIAWLKRFFPVEKLYPRTIVTYAEAERLIMEHNYENIKKIERVQDIAEQYGILEHEKKQYAGETPQTDELVLLRVTDHYFRGRQRPWRQDHYVVLVGVSRDTYYIVNTYPLEIRELTKGDERWIQGDSLVFHYLGEKQVEDSVGFLKAETLLTQNLTLEKFRDALLLYRVSLRRLMQCKPGDALRQLIDYTEKIFYSCALMARKNPQDRVTAETWRKEIVAKEQEFREGL